MAALNSAAEGHYRISVLGWQVREQVAGRVPTDEPPANVRREFVADAYGRVLADLHALPSASPYLKAVEGFRAEALASIPG
jgi:aminoglycoside phosphotransferase (APT) family kinase protein